MAAIEWMAFSDGYWLVVVVDDTTTNSGSQLMHFHCIVPGFTPGLDRKSF